MQLKSYFQSFKLILVVALIVRLVAVVFSAGYGMHDDHFLVIEASASWVDGFDYNRWLPWTPGNEHRPDGHSFTYVGLNFLFFKFLKFIGIVDPMIQMFLNRLIHALASLVVVWYGMKITEKLSDRCTAYKTGWILALLWVLPFLSVRNLVEVAPLPFLMYATWLSLDEPKKRTFILVGILTGLAISFRYQIGVFAVGVALYYFFTKQFVPLVNYCLGILICFSATQGVVDYFIWGYPFAEFFGYVTYNMDAGAAYMTNKNYFMYFLVLSGVLFVPLGMLIMIGFFKSYKKYTILFIPTLLFLLFHSFYPNRQERFILTVLPYFIILGTMGFALFHTRRSEKWWNVSMIVFWILNIPMLLIATFMFSKKSRVESMYSIYNDSLVHKRILLEGTSANRVSMLPKYYSGKWDFEFVDRIHDTTHLKVNPQHDYDFVFFFDEQDLSNRISAYKAIYPEMELVKKCYPGFADVKLRQLNPRNANEYIEVWRTNAH